MRYLWILLSGMMLGGCARTTVPLTPEQKVDQEKRMRYFLDRSSPRHQGNRSEAAPGFSRTFTIKPKPERSPEASENVPML